VSLSPHYCNRRNSAFDRTIGLEITTFLKQKLIYSYGSVLLRTPAGHYIRFSKSYVQFSAQVRVKSNSNRTYIDTKAMLTEIHGRSSEVYRKYTKYFGLSVSLYGTGKTVLDYFTRARIAPGLYIYIYICTILGDAAHTQTIRRRHWQLSRVCARPFRPSGTVSNIRSRGRT